MKSRTNRRRRVAHALGAAVALGTLTVGSIQIAGATTTDGPSGARPVLDLAQANAVLSRIGGRCPWATAAAQRELTNSELARAVASRLTFAQLAHFVVLFHADGYENRNIGVAALCLPRLTLQDGPNGIATGDTGVTALPASIGIAASFDPALAYDYGRVLGAEARGKGIDVVQGPNLNLARVPESGRIFEGYGEDPDLVSAMGVADIEGIQSQGVLADAKHLTAYNQETARVSIDERVGVRALEELYLAPFRAAVEQGDVASIMCAYGNLNGVNDCSDRWLFDIVEHGWGFAGFIRSDLKAVRNDRAAFAAGLDLVKPGSAGALLADVRHHKLSSTTLRAAADRVLREMFRFHLVTRPLRGTPTSKVDTPAHATFATHAAESSMVLLENDGVLPLSPGADVAVIGADADKSAKTVGRGSAAVLDPFVSTPLFALKHALGRSTKVTYARGGPPGVELPQIPRSELIGAPPPGGGETTGTIVGDSGQPPGVTAPVPRSVLTANSPGDGPGWQRWEAALVVPKSGIYDFSIQNSGDTWAYLDASTIFASPGVHLRGQWSTSVALVAGHRYELRLVWYGQTGVSPPRLGMIDASPEIAHAVAVARHARVAIVFVSDTSSEGYDRPNLSLPGDADALIRAVAHVNPNTVVVLNTGGAVLTPWRSDVAAILEAWYPGEQDGTATAAVLTGRVDPSGRLPLTFPEDDSATDAAKSAAWPGRNGTVDYLENLDIGYRYDEVHSLTPAFSFGFGLDYTTFDLATPTVDDDGTSDLVTVAVENTGGVTGTAVVECYLTYPSDSGEPPEQLRAFGRVTLSPGSIGTVRLRLHRSDFEDYGTDGFVVPRGQFRVEIGTSLSDLSAPIDVSVPDAS